MSPWVCFAGNRHGLQRRTVSAEFLSHFQANYLSSAKYPLAITNILLQAFGRNLCIGYDIGCKFGTTVKNSPLGDFVTTVPRSYVSRSTFRTCPSFSSMTSLTFYD